MTWLEYNEALQELRTDSEIVVGTGAQATWRLRRADLMPRHFVVTARSDRAIIRPFSSEAVVTVNGRQLAASGSELHDGDVISAGSADFHFWATVPSESQQIVRPALAAHLIDVRRYSAHSLLRVSTGIGRDESNSLVIDDDAASSFHAEVRREAGGHALRTSPDATVTLNGRRVAAPVLLTEGDEIGIANLVLRYTREPLPPGVTIATGLENLTSTSETETSVLVAKRERSSPVGELSSAVPLRAPMRAVAFVSSVIAAVAIATLLFLHRGP
jgi:predicted component of type VI protein secretion system